MGMRAIGAALAASCLAASCAMLSAEAPLFTVADQDPAFTLTEGLWAAKEADCKVNPARSSPERDTCLDWARISRAPDGAWIVSSVGEDDDAPTRAVIVPAASRGTHALAPIYVAETVDAKGGGVSYGALVPRGDGAGPVKRLEIAGVSCEVITDDAPIEGVTVKREDGKIVTCVATTQDAVREATRRSVIDTLSTLGDSELVFVR